MQSWAKNGLSDDQIAYNMGISYSTLKVWKGKYPAILAALKKGKEVVDRQVKNALLKRALGYECSERTAKVVDRIRMSSKVSEGNLKIAIVWGGWYHKRKGGVENDKNSI